MENTDVIVERWSDPQLPTEAVIQRILDAEDLKPYRWSNSPGDVYSAHSHPYPKVVYCDNGSIVFGLPEQDEEIRLSPGDRLELPPGVVHDAVVGSEGVVCLEAHQR